MAAQNITINQGASKNGRDLVECLDRLGTEWMRLKRLHSCLAESRDDTADADASFVTPSKVFQFVDDVGSTTLSSAEARAGFNEVASLIATADAAMLQCTARFKQ